MNVWTQMLGNQILVSAVMGWVVAQFLKTLIDFLLNKSFNAERLVGSGGMPSSHSATVCGMTTAAMLRYGVGSFEFAVSFEMCIRDSDKGVIKQRRQLPRGGCGLKFSTGRYGRISPHVSFREGAVD